ncbi:prephenate dehydrogenase/arogenate dehydrogenase family protein [Novosphingobium sp.]|uniref:prephenate dehydrogenase/arogenate dehydrogenase family protein n=1 Tax=Novosphingobium sp. TaxID=1874826 RepID=UPI0031DC05A7
MASPDFSDRPSLGIIGFGAFGRLIADHLRDFLKIYATDSAPLAEAPEGVTLTDLARVCACDIVVLAVPVAALGALCAQIAPLLRPGALVMDVGSVKVEPARIMVAQLPPHVSVIATHPMFGPQSIGGRHAGAQACALSHSRR